MKKVLSLITSFLLILCCGFSQRFDLSVLKSGESRSFSSSLFTYKNGKPRFAQDSVLILKNGLKIREYKIYEKTIQNITPNKYNTIGLLVGYILNEMVMVVDKNRNSNYTDDSVYIYNLSSTKITNKELRKSLPLIKIDSLEIISVGGDKSYYATSIYFCATPKLNKINIGFNSNSKKEEISLMVLGDSSYHTEPFLYKNNLYHLEISPHPFTFPVYPVKNLNCLFGNLSLIKHINADSFRMVGFQVAEYVLNDNGIMNFEEGRLLVNKFDFASKTIALSIFENIDNADSNLIHFKKYKYQLIKNKLKQNIPIEDKHYTIVEFAGSWCKPCRDILPEIKKINAQIKDTINIVPIFKEASFNVAADYYKKVAPSWDVYYEPLKCNDIGCLSKLYNIGVYPTVLLLNKRGEVLFRSSGSGCIYELQEFIKKWGSR